MLKVSIACEKISNAERKHAAGCNIFFYDETNIRYEKICMQPNACRTCTNDIVTST